MLEAFELVQIFLDTHGVHCLFNCMIYWLIGEFLSFHNDVLFLEHSGCVLSVYLCDGKLSGEAVGISSLCNFPKNLDCRLFCYAHMVCPVCFFFVVHA